jgi:hypothetical protein
VAADEHELIALERRGWEALSSDGGGAYYREHLADDAVMAFGFGVLSREQALAAMSSAPPWATFEIDEPRVVELTADSAVVVYRVRAQRAGDAPYEAVASSTFVRRGGTWQLAFHQQTPAG